MNRLLFFLMLACSLFAASVSVAFEVANLSVPESFIVDDATGYYYISNINGKPTEKNNNGFITKLNPDGTLLDKKFVQGGKKGVTLNAPKGLLISGEFLYVSDIDHIRVFDKKSGDLKREIDFRSFDPKFLNDLAMDYNGRIYVTDMGANRIYRIDPTQYDKVKLFASGDEFASPNGIRFTRRNGKLLVAMWDTGELLWIDLFGKTRKYVTKKKLDTGLDGLDFDEDGNLFVSSFTAGKIFRISIEKGLEELVTDLVSPADISLDRKKRLILVPSFSGNRAFTLNY